MIPKSRYENKNFFTDVFLCGYFFVSAAQAEETVQNAKHLWDYQTKHFNAYSLQDDIRIGEKYLAEQKNAFEQKKLEVNPARFENTPCPDRRSCPKFLKSICL